MNKGFSSIFLGIILCFFIQTGYSSIIDLSKIPCELPWEQFTTESNTIGIFFEDKSESKGFFLLPITNSPAPGYTVEMKFSMRSLIGSDRTSSVGFKILENVETFGKKKDCPGHFLVLFDNNGNLDIKRWNGSYYSVVAHRSRFTFTPGRQQSMKVDVSPAGSIKVYLNNKLQMAYRFKKKVLESTPVSICAMPGTSLEVVSFEIR